VRNRIANLLASFAEQSTGSASRVERAILLDVPPSLDAGEITDKGSLNQRAMLRERQHLVDDLYADSPPDHVICCTPIPASIHVDRSGAS
jgi:feruloyl-CoA synthase